MTSISIDSAGNTLKNLLTRTQLGETVTLLDDDGKPLALLVSLHQESTIESDVETNAEWDTQWDALAGQISSTWNSDQSAVETLADYSEAIRLNPEDADAYNNRGVTYYNQEQYEQALADYDEAIRLNPEDATTYKNRGNTYYNQEQYEQALADYSEAIRLNPEYAGAFYNTACAYALQSDIEAALPPLRRALELDTEFYLNLTATDTDFDPIRNHSAFIALLAEFSSQK